MYDTETYVNDRGNTLLVIYVHGKRDDGKGGSVDVTEALVVHQSADNKIFHSYLIEHNEFFENRLEICLKTYKDRGYKTPGSDTEEKSTLEIEMYDEDKGHPLNDLNLQGPIVIKRDGWIEGDIQDPPVQRELPELPKEDDLSED